MSPLANVLLPVSLTLSERRPGMAPPSSHVSVPSTLSKDNASASRPGPEPPLSNRQRQSTTTPPGDWDG